MCKITIDTRLDQFIISLVRNKEQIVSIDRNLLLFYRMTFLQMLVQKLLNIVKKKCVQSVITFEMLQLVYYAFNILDFLFYLQLTI